MISKKPYLKLMVILAALSWEYTAVDAQNTAPKEKSLLQCGIANHISKSRCQLEEVLHDQRSDIELEFSFELESNCSEVESNIEISLNGESHSILDGRRLYRFTSTENPLKVRAKNPIIFKTRVLPSHCKLILFNSKIQASSNQWRQWVEELEFHEKNLNASSLSLALNLDILQMSSALNLLSKIADNMARELSREDLLDLRTDIPSALKLLEKISASESNFLSAPEILILSKIQLILNRVEDDSFWQLENGETRNFSSLLTGNEKEMLDSAIQKANNFDQQQLLEHLRSHHLESIKDTKAKIDQIKKIMKLWSQE